MQNVNIKMQNDSAKFQNHSDFVGIPKFCILIFKFWISYVWQCHTAETLPFSAFFVIQCDTSSRRSLLRSDWHRSFGRARSFSNKMLAHPKLGRKTKRRRALVVQWIRRRPAKLEMQVRFLPRAHRKCKMQISKCKMTMQNVKISRLRRLPKFYTLIFEFWF